MSSSDGCFTSSLSFSDFSLFQINLLKNCTTYQYLPKWQHRSSLVMEMGWGLFRELLLCNSFSVSVSSVPGHTQHNKSPPLAAEDSEHVVRTCLASSYAPCTFAECPFPSSSSGDGVRYLEREGEGGCFQGKSQTWRKWSGIGHLLKHLSHHRHYWPMESSFAREILNCIIFQKLQRSSLLRDSGLLSLLAGELQRSERCHHVALCDMPSSRAASIPGSELSSCGSVQGICAGTCTFPPLTDKKCHWRCHFSSVGGFDMNTV